MKKILFILILFLSFSVNVSANDKVTLNKCIDGDTAWFNLNGEIVKVRFLAIDTPESTNQIEEFGKEASIYTCNILTNASNIELEYDDNATKDKYGRTLAWIFVDDKLLQELIIKEGLGEVAYLYDDYKYTSTLQATELIAKTNKVGMWQEDYSLIYILITLTIITLLSLFSKKIRLKVINILKKQLKKTLK